MTTREQHARSARGRLRRDAPPRRDRVSALEFGRERFRFRLLRDQRRLTDLDIDPHVQQVTWRRDSAVRTGELNFRRPLTGPQAAAIAQGDRVRCEVDLHGTGRWRRLWQMTVAAPDHQIAEGLMALALKAEHKALEADKAAFSYKRMNARQITLAVAERFKVKVGKLPEAHHEIDKLVRKSAHPIDVVTAAWAEERKETGRRFDIDISRGRLDVTELAEPTVVLEVGELITDATVKQTLRMMASAVVVTSTRKDDGRTKKIRVRVVDERRVRRFGYIVRHVNKPNLGSEAAARRYGEQILARESRPLGSVTFDHPGLPFLDRGAVIQLGVPEGFLNYLAFVRSTSHHLSAGSYTMTVEVGFKDPWIDVRKERAKKKREAAKRRRRRRGGGEDTPRPQPKKAAWRAGV